MPGTYSQIYIQIIFAVKGRESLIHASWEDELYRYISGIIKNKGYKLFAINGMPDHVHILIGMRPSGNLSDLVREVKKSSNDFIKEKRYIRYKFRWQEGFGAFSYSHSSLKNVIAYVENQKAHHKKKTFGEEYRELLNEFNVEFKEEFLFERIR